MSRKPSDDGLSFSIVPQLDSNCIGCGAQREPEGESIVHHGSTWIIKTDQPCDCGESRVRVGFRVEAG